MEGGNRGPLCAIPGANVGGPLLTGPDALIWVGEGGPDVRGEEDTDPGRGPGPEKDGAAGPPICDGNTPGGGGLDAKGGG